MKVSELITGDLYGIDTNPRVCVVIWKNNEVSIPMAEHAVQWRSDKHCLKGKPALYCGPVSKPTHTNKQGHYKMHMFMIAGQLYYVPGEHIKNIYPYLELIRENKRGWESYEEE
jgi:hypothetical protein|tara:strand:- start:726 stop:1067 length:342 start_codon:yes stop_codon:yes gene_type:complete